MKLNDRIITSFIFDGKHYYIDLAFDNVLDVLDITEREDLTDLEKVNLGLALFLGDREIEKPLEIWEYINKEIIHKEKRSSFEYDILGNKIPIEDSQEEVSDFFDIKQDADLIFSSFWAEYGMDLYEQQGRLHWHKFQALLQGLPSDSPLQKVIQIRLWKPQKGESAEHKKNMKRLQNYYRIVTE